MKKLFISFIFLFIFFILTACTNTQVSIYKLVSKNTISNVVHYNNDFYICTYHSLEDINDIRIYDGDDYKIARLVDYDPLYDMALLNCKGLKPNNKYYNSRFNTYNLSKDIEIVEVEEDFNTIIEISNTITHDTIHVLKAKNNGFENGESGGLYIDEKNNIFAILIGADDNFAYFIKDTKIKEIFQDYLYD